MKRIFTFYISSLLIAAFLYLYFTSYTGWLGNLHSPSYLGNYLGYPFIATDSLIARCVYSIVVAVFIAIILSKFWSKSKYFILALLFIFLLALGFDEILINKAINRPDLTCKIDSDCEVKVIVPYRGWCEHVDCANRDWNYYWSVFGSNAHAIQCVGPPTKCVCKEEKCVGKGGG